jgi:hypothetical protein
MKKVFPVKMGFAAAGIAVFFTAILMSTAAFALTQPDGSPIPSQMGCSGPDPTGLAAVFACSCIEAGVCNIGGTCAAPGDCPTGQKGTCETTLYHIFNDDACIPSQHTGLDPWAEAATEPETFSPSITLKFTVVSRGMAIFKNVFGWYNVTGSAPSADDMHVMLDCNSPADTTVTLDIKKEPAWSGGRVGFFIITPESHTAPASCGGGDCCATLERYNAGVGYAYFSERKYNPDHVGENSYIHLLVYKSHVTGSKFYFAWEDVYGGSTNDFTDLVTSVEGIRKTGSSGGNLGFLAWFLRPKKEGGCHTDVAGGGLSGGLVFALAAAGLSRRRKRR